MSALSESFRKKASDQVAASAPLFDEPDFDTNAKKQALAIIGQVNATVLTSLADVLESGRLNSSASAIRDSVGASSNLNNAIRLAAARATVTGDWNEFDRLASGGSTSGTNGGATPTSGTP
jgi:hypothetical protein